MRKQLFILTVFCLLLWKEGFSQGSDAVHPSHIFLELGGNAPVMSLNYERRLSGTSSGFGVRAGVGLAGLPGHIFPQIVTTIPIGITYLLGGGPHHLDLGAGVTIGTEKFGSSDWQRRSGVFFVPSAGYRFQKQPKGFVLRVFASPLLSGNTNAFSAGVSFGRRF